LRSALAASALLGLTSCVVNPVTGNTELALVSAADEVGIGEAQYAPSRQMQGGDYVVDPALVAPWAQRHDCGQCVIWFTLEGFFWFPRTLMDIAKLGYVDEYVRDLSRLVLLRARIAKDAGCQGVVCSGREVASIKKELRDLIAVTPGIRPAWSVVNQDDQKRIVTPQAAVRNGADYIVVGRPIRDAGNPSDAAKKVAEEIDSVLQCELVPVDGHEGD